MNSRNNDHPAGRTLDTPQPSMRQGQGQEQQPAQPRPKGLAGVAHDIAFGDIEEKDKRCLFVLRWAVVALGPLMFGLFGAWVNGEELDPKYVERMADAFGPIVACPECPSYDAPTLICPPWPGDGKPVELEIP